MGKPLVIVESPTKARKIAEYLGSGYVVEASVGHIRDLPQGAAEIPPAVKGEPWARLAVNVDDGFAPVYIVPKEKREQVKKLKDLLKQADEVYLATDEDREGESISWHLQEVLKPKVPVKRMVFHEITKKAIQAAVANPRDLDLPLVDAQETRRILDRLYGYEVSQVLWRKVSSGLSAGRVQSVATRIVVERERERMAFRSAGYWGLSATLAADGDGDAPARFPASLLSLDEVRVATGRDFDQQGRPRGSVVVLDEEGARRIAAGLEGQPFTVRSVEEKPYRSQPKAPFMTSTLQQEAGRKLRMTSKRAMQVAQKLYENGYITYMRTDSTSLSAEAIAAARSQAAQLYGPAYVPDQPRRYDRKVKNAQEAHEAIRPAGEVFRTPDEVAREVGPDEASLYDLIWKRTVASQMADATGSQVSVRLAATSVAAAGPSTETLWSASGRTITFPGYLRAYVEGADDPEAELEDRQAILPALAVDQRVAAQELSAEGHQTQPPARYTEASLVAKLEELGVGRPSTYASILGTIQDRGYVWKKGSALVPTWTAFAVVHLLEEHFGRLVDYQFTAKLEDDLDLIAAREAERVPWLQAFYFGDGGGPDGAAGAGGVGGGGGGGATGLKELCVRGLDEIDPRAINSIPIADGIVVRVGKYGPYLQRDGGDERASIPEDLAPDELTPEKAEELLALGSREDEPIGTDPETGLPVYVKVGRFGAYVQLGEMPEGKGAPKPKRASLFKSMHPDTVSLEQALQLLSLPRVLGVDPATGEEVTAQNGRFGPYLKKGTDSRSLQSEDQLLAIGLDEALEIYSRPKYGGRAAAAPPLRELGPDPTTGSPMVVKEGRYGHYLTDGETNVTVKDGWEELTPERAAELLADKRALGPAKKAGRRAGGAAKKAGGATKKAAGATKKAAGATKAAGTAKALGVTKVVGATKKAPAAKKAAGASPGPAGGRG